MLPGESDDLTCKVSVNLAAAILSFVDGKSI